MIAPNLKEITATVYFNVFLIQLFSYSVLPKKILKIDCNWSINFVMLTVATHGTHDFTTSFPGPCPLAVRQATGSWAKAWERG